MLDLRPEREEGVLPLPTGALSSCLIDGESPRQEGGTGVRRTEERGVVRAGSGGMGWGPEHPGPPF